MDAHTDRLHFLDSLRGLAALYVVFYHTHSMLNLKISSLGLTHGVDFGRTGVFLFFVISGFSLSMTMPRHDRTPLPAASYAISRLFRIAPLFWFMLGVSVFRDAALFHFHNPAAEIALNAVFLFNLVPGHQAGIVWASWTIGVEMFFYLLFIPIYRMAPRHQACVAIATLAAFSAMTLLVPQDYYFLLFIGYLPLFVAGMLAFEAYARLRHHSHASMFGWLLLAIGLSAVAVLALCCNDAGAKIIYRVPIGLAYAAVLLGCGLARLPFLNAPILLFYGRISFSLYLLHTPLVFACGRYFRVIYSWFPETPAYFISACLVLSVATPLAYLTYRFIEVPGNRLGAIIIARIRPAWTQNSANAPAN